MLKSILRSIGIGGARVDTVVDHPEVEVGGTLSGEVRITGGSGETDLREVALELVTRCMVETRGDEKVYAEIALAQASLPGGLIRAGETRNLPFELDVPEGAPISLGSTSTVLRTRLEVPGAVDPRDADPVLIRPNRAMAAVFQGMERAGFRLAETEVEYNRGRRNPFVQEFDFRPRSRADFGIEEVEISFSPIRGGVDVAVTVDSRGGFFSMGGERATRFRVTEAEIPRLDIAAELRGIISALRR